MARSHPTSVAARKEAREAALEEIDRMVQEGTLVCRQATPEERDRFGITAWQERRGPELQNQQPARPDARRSAKRSLQPVDPELATRLRAARQAELDAPDQMNRLLVSVVAAGAMSRTRIHEITGLSLAWIAERLARTRAGLVAPVEVVDAEAQLREARARELRAAGELDRLIVDAVDGGVTQRQIAAVIEMHRATLNGRVARHRATRCEGGRESHQAGCAAASAIRADAPPDSSGSTGSSLPGRPDAA